MKRKLIGLIAAISILSACQTPTPTSVAPESTQEPIAPLQAEVVATPKKGGLLKISMRHPNTFNPLLNEDIVLDKVLRLVFEPLAIIDENQKVVPNLLESINFATDGLSAVLTLKPNLKWSDGTPITPEDIVYSLEVLKTAPELAIYKSSIQNIAAYEVTTGTSGQTDSVRLTYHQNFGGATYQLCFPVIPKHYYKENNLPEALPLGNGLYSCTGYESMKALTMSASISALGKEPYISNIEAIVLSDQSTDLSAFDQDMIDAISVNISDWGRYLSSDDASAAAYTTQYFDFIGFNFEKPAFQNKNMRMAIAHLLDKNKLISDVYASHATITNVPINPSSWLYNSNVKNYDYNVETAKGLITEVPTTPFKILVNSENEERIKIANMLKEELLGVNIQTEVDSCSFAEYEQRLKDKDFDLFVGGFNLSMLPDLTFMLHSSQDVGMNYFSYKDDHMDALLTTTFTAPSESAFKSAHNDLQMYISEELPCISLVFRESVLLTDNRVHGNKKPNSSNVYYNIDEWFIN